MLFAPDTMVSLEFTATLANTHPTASKTGVDELTTLAELDELAYQFTGRFDHDLAELEEVRETRDLIRSIWQLDRDGIVREVNRMMREANALPYLARHDDFDWHLHATEADAPLAERMRVEVGLALLDVVRTDQVDRLRECEAEDCDGVLADLSRNGSKRFCSVRCGNRVNMTAWRARQED